MWNEISFAITQLQSNSSLEKIIIGQFKLQFNKFGLNKISKKWFIMCKRKYGKDTLFFAIIEGCVGNLFCFWIKTRWCYLTKRGSGYCYHTKTWVWGLFQVTLVQWSVNRMLDIQIFHFNVTKFNWRKVLSIFLLSQTKLKIISDLFKGRANLSNVTTRFPFSIYF